MPLAMRLFERLWITSLILGVATLPFFDVRAEIEAETGEVLPPWFENALGLGMVIAFLVTLGLVLLTSRRANTITRTIIVALFALSALGLLDVGAYFSRGWITVSSIVQLFLQAGALYMLFRPESRAYFDATRQNRQNNQGR